MNTRLIKNYHFIDVFLSVVAVSYIIIFYNYNFIAVIQDVHNIVNISGLEIKILNKKNNKLKQKWLIVFLSWPSCRLTCNRKKCS